MKVKRAFGGAIFLMGLVLAGWIGYNLLVERMAVTQGMSFLLGVIMTAGFLFVGYRWMRGQQA